jgi:hypothetical protein
MKKIAYLISLAALCISVFSCKKDEDNNKTENKVESGVIELKGTISKDSTLKADRKYLLSGYVYVQAPATLTIEAGTVIKGDKDSKGTLVIERGAKINAEGTAQKPIVFTSGQPAGSRGYGDWGGLVILGKSTENQPGSPIIEGKVDRPFGGSDAEDNSGVLKYVRIEFAGIALETNNEINGLTLGAVGSKTTIDHIQISYSGDDAFEWFGGTVNAKYLVAYKSWDDDFDTDFGFSGKVQYGLVVRDPNIADVSKSNGFESDNDGQGSAATPQTSGIFANVSVFGPLATPSAAINSQYGSAAHLRRNTALSVYNSLFSGYKTGLLIDGTAMDANMQGSTFKFSNNIIAGLNSADTVKVAGSASADITKTWFTAGNNRVIADNSVLSISNAFAQTGTPGFIPAANSPLMNGAYLNLSTLSSFFENTNYIGAFSTSDWTAGWTNWDPQNTQY